MDIREARIEYRKGHAGVLGRDDTVTYAEVERLRDAVPEYASDWAVMVANDARLMLVAPDNSGGWEHHVLIEFVECEHPV